jgi:hypothetical protein
VEKTAKEIHSNLYPSSHIIRVTKHRRMRWAGHVAWNLGINEKIILKLVLKK